MSEIEATTVDIQEPQINNLGADNTNNNITQTNSTENPSSSTVATDQANQEEKVETPKPALEGPELEAAIIQQVEYYFSPKNLVRDVFLNKQMDKDPNKFVNISVLATFNKLKALTTDINVLANALRKSNKLTVSEDNEKVRPNNPSSRAILDKTFADREELQAFFKTILYKYAKDEILREEDRKYVEALLQYHTNKDAKIGCGIQDIKLGNAIGYDDTLCFVIVRTDGTTEDFSYIKCINNLDPTFGARKRKHENKEKKEKQRQEKEQREVPAPQKGCIVKILNVKPELDYRQLKDHNKQFGDVAFVTIEGGTGFVRFKSQEAANNALTDSSKFAGDSSTLEILTGEDEDSFLAKIPIGVPKGKGFRGRGRGRGRGGKRQKN
jgi:hypothetical protein